MDELNTAGGTVDDGSGGGGQQTATNDINTPSPIDLTNPDTLIRIKGSDKPVKFGDHVRGFQSEFTKASQRASKLESDLKTATERLRQLETAQQQAQRAQQSQTDPYAQLRALPYLKGEEAVALVQQIEASQKERDMVLVAALKKLQELQGVVTGLNQSASSSAFEAKIGKFVKDAGLSDKWTAAARKLYLAYEGDDLDEQFPSILDNYVKEIRALNEAERAEQLERSRRLPFVPGKGGQAGPTRPLQIKPNATPADIANELFPFMNSSET